MSKSLIKAGSQMDDGILQNIENAANEQTISYKYGFIKQVEQSNPELSRMNQENQRELADIALNTRLQDFQLKANQYLWQRQAEMETALARVSTGERTKLSQIIADYTDKQETLVLELSRDYSNKEREIKDNKFPKIVEDKLLVSLSKKFDYKLTLLKRLEEETIEQIMPKNG